MAATDKPFVRKRRVIRDGEGRKIAMSCDSILGMAACDKMVLAVNAHDGLVAVQEAFFRLMGCDHANWYHWHDLLTIRDSRRFNPHEKAEYEDFLKIVAVLDERDALAAAKGVEGG